MKKLLTRNFILRWGIRIGAIALLYWGVLSKFDAPAVHYTMVIIIPFLIGAFNCGWTCPLGIAQDILHRRRLDIDVPYRLHNILRVLRYVFGALFISGLFVLPAAIMFSFSNANRGEVVFGLALYLAIASLVVSIFINRFFCRYICPLGAIKGVKGLLRPITINRDVKKCDKCRICDRECPMKIVVSRTVSSWSPNCINCYECIEKCPRGALSIGARKYLAKQEKE